MGLGMRRGKKWSSRTWHGFWRNLWDILYRKPAKQRGIGFGPWWLGCILYGLFALTMLKQGKVTTGFSCSASPWLCINSFSTAIRGFSNPSDLFLRDAEEGSGDDPGTSV
jgi:hypothetical protein